MRELKFRQPLWDEHNKFIEFHYWGFVNGSFIEPIFSPESTLKEAREQSQQFTGLKDKNGKEIYEGDKLRSTATKVANPSIKICEWEGIGFDPFVADCEHSGDGWHWEIVGNIHAETEE